MPVLSNVRRRSDDILQNFLLPSVLHVDARDAFADTYRSNGKRWISLKRAESADFLPVKTIGTIDPVGVPSARCAP